MVASIMRAGTAGQHTHHEVDVHGVDPAAAALQRPQLHRVLANVVELDVLALACSREIAGAISCCVVDYAVV